MLSTFWERPDKRDVYTGQQWERQRPEKRHGLATGEVGLKISQKGLYALHAMMTLARRYQQGASTIRDVASESDLPVKFHAYLARI